MLEILSKIDETNEGVFAYAIASVRGNQNLHSFQTNEVMPLASAAKVAIAYAVTKLVEAQHLSWEDKLDDVLFDPKEDSNELYPHLIGRSSIQLGEAIEVMIACHDSIVAKLIVTCAGGWEKINRLISEKFPSMHVTENPRDDKNIGTVEDLFAMMNQIRSGYERNPFRWSPIIRGLVRQRGENGIVPSHLISHMTGGLEQALLNIGFIGNYAGEQYIYAIAAKNVPNRSENTTADMLAKEFIENIYRHLFCEGN
ncbi:serine hydrolase [Paenisporosarcina cavernae]|uniref:Beta-lactamase class A catalytic domain-containing protein n=1 Tax=Paenisporosarcina cavernae TaxID=2320858 RepID=A0A385YTT6_9BACL|nr:serine hydrolase [Paenisporosarcina cavernae]AYC30076.1 hypothetical protein D3873_09390 [Paenisporosarcina cavernae]